MQKTTSLKGRNRMSLVYLLKIACFMPEVHVRIAQSSNKCNKKLSVQGLCVLRSETLSGAFSCHSERCGRCNRFDRHRKR